MSIWFTPIDLIAINRSGKNNMLEFLGIEFIDSGEDYLTARMPVDQRTQQPCGILHGGASCVLAETAGSVAAHYCINPEFYFCVGLDINTNHIRSVRSGYVLGIARPFHVGSSTQVWGIEVRNESEQLIAMSRLTVMVLKKSSKL